MTIPIADRLELSGLVHRYAALVDDRDVERTLELFSTGGELMLPDPPDVLDPVRTHRGADAIRVALSAVTTVGRTHHSIDSEIYRAGADLAEGRIAATAHHWNRRADGLTDVVWYLRYDDRYVRTDAGWRIAHRALTIDAIETRPMRRLR